MICNRFLCGLGKIARMCPCGMEYFRGFIGVIQRRLMVLENQGAIHLFGETALELSDLMQMDA